MIDTASDPGPWPGSSSAGRGSLRHLWQRDGSEVIEGEPVLIRFWRDERAATAIEYCLVAGLVSLAVVAGASAIGSKLSQNYYGKIGANLS